MRVVYKELLDKMLKNTKMPRGKNLIYVFYGFNKDFYGVANEFLKKNEITHIVSNYQNDYIDIGKISKKDYKVNLNQTVISLNNNS